MRLNKCGHPQEWTLKLRGYGRTYTYCIMCLMEKVGLRHIEKYESPSITKIVEDKPVSNETITKPKNEKEVDEKCQIKTDEVLEKEAQEKVNPKADEKKETVNK